MTSVESPIKQNISKREPEIKTTSKLWRWRMQWFFGEKFYAKISVAMANIAVQRIKREFKEVVKNEEVCITGFFVWISFFPCSCILLAFTYVLRWACRKDSIRIFMYVLVFQAHCCVYDINRCIDSTHDNKLLNNYNQWTRISAQLPVLIVNFHSISYNLG